jgi:uncharacterized protein
VAHRAYSFLLRQDTIGQCSLDLIAGAKDAQHLKRTDGCASQLGRDGWIQYEQPYYADFKLAAIGYDFFQLSFIITNRANCHGFAYNALLDDLGTTSFHQKQVLDVRGTLILSIPTVIGSVIGAMIAVDLNEIMMRRVIGVVMVIMLVLLLTRPQRWLHGQTIALQGFPDWKHFVAFFAIGLYGGFIQMGVGIFLLSGLVLGLGYNLVRANAVKLGINFFFTAAALLVFQSNGQVQWLPGLALALGTSLGALAAARIAVERGAVLVHRLLIVVVIISALQLLGLFELVARLY